MATQTITSKTLYGSYKNGTALASSATDYGYIGYSNSTGTYKYSVCYKMVLPTVTGTISSITLTPTIKNCNTGNLLSGKKYKVGVAHATNTHYAGGSADVTGYWTNTLTLSQNLSSGASYTFSSTTFSSDENAAFSSGDTLYVYMYAGDSGIISKAELTGWTASITYTAESVTGTTLTVGTSSSNVNLTTCYPVPTSSSSTRVYYKVSGLANPVNTYEYFKVYLYDGFSFTNGGAVSSGTLLATYTPNSTDTNTYFTSTLTVPSSNFKVGGGKIGIVVVAATTAYPDKYWKIGGSGTDPKICYINLTYSKWLTDAIDCDVVVTGKDTATAIVTLNAINSPRYLNTVYLRTAATSSAGATSAAGTSVGSATFTASTSTMQTKNINLSGLSPGETVTYYTTTYGSTSYNSKSYRGIGSVTFTTDGDYSATIDANVSGATAATLTMSNLSTTVNLYPGLWCVSTTNVESTTDASTLENAYGVDWGSIDTDEFVSPADLPIELTNLNPATEYNMYAYVFSSASSRWYQCGSVNFKTHSNIYYTSKTTGELIPCWTYMLLESTTILDTVHTYNVTSTIRDESANGENLLCYRIHMNGSYYYIALNNVYESGDVITINEDSNGILTSDQCDIFFTQPSGYSLQSTTLEFVSEENTIVENKLEKVLLDVSNCVK